jgi:energy-coupling factor transporter ATP-binding protein EcfA2
MSRFQKATRRKAKARIALVGPSGSGKSYTALLIARGLVGPEGRIAAIDTERGSLSKYAVDVERPEAGGVTDFDTLDLDHHAPAEYVKALRDAAAERYDVVIIDSLSHAWNGRGGALEQVDQAAKRSSGNSFAAWRDVTPQHNQLVDAILAYPGHVIVTMRAKTEYVLEAGKNGKTAPRKVGLAPIQRDGMEYEFDVCADIDLDHNFIVTKSRVPDLTDVVIDRAGIALGEGLARWLEGGAEAPAAKPAADPANLENAIAGRSVTSPLTEAIEDLGQVECDRTLVAWFERHLPAMGRATKEQVKPVWAAVNERAALIELAADDIRPCWDEAKERLAAAAKAA